MLYCLILGGKCIWSYYVINSSTDVLDIEHILPETTVYFL